MVTTKRIAAALSICAVVCCGAVSAAPALDENPDGTSASAYGMRSAETLNELGIMQGRGDGFELWDNVTRAEAVVLLARTLWYPQATGEAVDFPDVDTETLAWAVPSIYTFSAAGLVKGDDDGNFSPYRNVTGREFMNICCRAAGFEEYEDEPETVFDIPSAVELDAPLSRADAAELCVMLLTSETSTGQTVYERISAYGGYDSRSLRKALLYKVPELSETLFADELNDRMPQDKNYMVSPMSLKMLLGIAANGASGETRGQILDTAYISDLGEYNAQAAADIERYSNAESIELEVADSAWINTDVTSVRFKDGFANRITESYAAQIGTVNSADALDTINGWVSEKTRGRINSIFDNSNFDFALINAVYFNGSWADEFDPGNTKKDVFTDLNGEEHEIEFMRRSDNMMCSTENGLQIVKLPYLYDSETKTSISMYVIKTGDGTLVKNPANETESAALKSAKVNLSIPKFKNESQFDMKDILGDMGITKAFGETAEFAEMIEGGDVHIDVMTQKTYINVDEKGTEAAAVTGGGGTSAPMPQETLNISFDTPFSYVIKDDTSGRILFMGAYAFAGSRGQ